MEKLNPKKMVATVANAPTSTNHNNNKAASKWMRQQLEMMLFLGQAVLALPDALLVRAFMSFGCDNWCMI